jgi:hypothetical protein
MKFKILITLSFLISICFANTDKQLEKRIVLHGVVKPQKMSTLVAIGEGIVSKVIGKLGKMVKPNDNLLQVFEKESVRNYRNTIDGKIAKIHVTEGAAISPGMPLVTVVNDQKLYMELSLSPQTANSIQQGYDIYLKNKNKKIANIVHIAPIVDPDNGSVKAISSQLDSSLYRIGQIISVEVSFGVQDCHEVVPLNEVNNFTQEYQINFIYNQKACLIKNKQQ